MDPIEAEMQRRGLLGTGDPVEEEMRRRGLIGPPEEMSDGARRAGIVGEGVVRGATGILGLPVSAFNAAEEMMMVPRRAIADLMGWERAKAEMKPLNIPVGDVGWLQDQAKQLPIPGTDLKMLGNPQFEPKSTGEKLLSAAAEGATSGAMLPLGAAGAIARGVSGAAAGASGEASREYYDGSGMDRALRSWSPTAGAVVAGAVPVVGSIAGAMAGGAAVNAATKAGNYIAQKSGLAGDYAAEGITPRLAGDLSENDFLRRTQSALRDTPGASGRMKVAAQQTIDDLDRAVDLRAGQLGTAKDAVTAGQTLQSGAQRFADQFKAESGRRYGVLDQYLPKDTPVRLNSTESTLNHLTRTMNDAPNVAESLTSPLYRNLKESLAKDMAATGGTVRYETLKRFRSEIGSKLSDPAFYADTSTAEIKALYRALSDDMLSAAQSRGPMAVNAYNHANNFFSAGIKNVEDVAAKVAAKGITPEQAYNVVMQGAKNGPTNLQQFRKIYTDDEWGMLSSAVLRKMGAAKAGVQDATGEVFSPSTFLTNWNSLHPQARAILANGDPGTMEAWNRLARIAGSMKETASLANTSRTAGTAAFMGVLGTLGSGLGGAVGALYGGGAGAAAGAVAGAVGTVGAGMAGANVAARLMTNPAFARWLATPVGEAGISAATRRLVGVAAAAPEIRSEIRLFLDLLRSEPDSGSTATPGSPPASQ